jgi:branched-chain amino acid transport system substrate-binding protein
MLLCTSGSAGEATAPFFNARKHRAEYVGPGREEPPPADLREIEIGYFGPSDPSDPRAGDMWRAAELAVADANAEGGVRGKPIRLVTAWSGNPWQAAVKQLTDLVFVRKVWAIVGGADSASSHLAEQVVAKANVPLVCPVSSDKTVNLANVPWTFAVVPGDQLLAPLLVDAMVPQLELRRLARLMTDDHDSRMFSREMDHALQKRQIAVAFDFVVPAATPDFSDSITRAIESHADVILLVANAEDSARLIKSLRSSGFEGLVVGGPSMGRRAFLSAAGGAGQGAIFPLLFDAGESPGNEFVARFKKVQGCEPDFTAAHTYDAVRLTVEAIRVAGLNRARIRDAIAGLSPWNGVSGRITWDGLGSNTRSAEVGTIREGCFQVAPKPLAPTSSPPRSAEP